MPPYRPSGLQTLYGPGGGRIAPLGRTQAAGPARAVMNPKLALDPQLERSDDEAVSPPVIRTRDLHLNGLRLARAWSSVVDSETLRRLGHVLAESGSRCDRLALPARPGPDPALPGAGPKIGVVLAIRQRLDPALGPHLPVT